MNFLLPRDDSEEHLGTKTCFYCNKVFSSHRALGGHLRIHQDGRILRAPNYPGRSRSSVNNTGNPPASLPNSELNSFASFNSLSAITSNSVNNSGNPPASLPNSQLNSSSSFNSPTQFSTSSVNNSGNSPASLPNNQLNSTAFNSLTLLPAAHLACDFSWMIYLNETNQVSRSQFIGGYSGVPLIPVILSPDFSYGYSYGATYHHNSLASRAFAPVGSNVDFPYVCSSCAAYYHNILASRAFVPVGMIAAMPSAAFALFGSVVAPGFLVDSSLFLGSNGVRQFNTNGFQISQVTLSPSFGNALPNVQAQNAGPPSAVSANVGRSERRSSGKRSREADRSRNAETSNASRRPRIAPNEHVEQENRPKKELQLFVDVVVPSSSSEASSSAEEEDPVDMDLSLHL
ncbi:hypothetical protein GOBAR_AA16226 [Gossypium barbadense]|uniref:C2H2-type domain-containing protein n=1 Tax=Gossypium barbadense TaxID=3634 RepID=A0A2P5XM72_GOSBA|nr:hypothetical protein GOBAR_AA16226 [Gossypium barbadense]